MKRLVAFLLLAGAVSSAWAFQVAEIRSGMGREEVRQLLGKWKFDRIQDQPDALLAYDLAEKGGNRQFNFYFCNDRLAAVEQEMQPSIKSLIVITENYTSAYGQPMKVAAGTNIVSLGEKNSLAMYWRTGSDLIGVKLVMLPPADQLFVVHETPNGCWTVPR